MGASAEINRYLNNHYEGMYPEQLILMLFKGALDRIHLAGEGIEENNIQKRGENLSKAIAIVSELNSSVDTSMNDESTQFLRGLYSAILTELPKVSLTNDLETLRRAHAYISKLKEIWETEVMGKGVQHKKPAGSLLKQYGSGTGKNIFHSIAV
jgi:flagellar protein FliS